MKTFIKTEISTSEEQLIKIQPNPKFDGITLSFSEFDGSSDSNLLYIDKEELPIIIKKLQEMMDYVNETSK